jgi:hypothetical protein
MMTYVDTAAPSRRARKEDRLSSSAMVFRVSKVRVKINSGKPGDTWTRS